MAQTVGLRGVITDESGASVAGATVTITGPEGLRKNAVSDSAGSYTFAGLPSGDYSVQAAAPQLALPQPVQVTLRSITQILNLQLRVAAVVQQVRVDDTAGPAVGTDPAANAGALVLRGDDLQALSDDPEDLAADLQALAGPSAGPSGGSVFIDGFSGGELPSKESIREIRINQNPFSPEFDSLGYGRIEIFTKPGTDNYHGNLNFNIANEFWNARNPYSAQKAPLRLYEYENTISGPLSRRASFSLDANQNNVDNGSIINAVVLDPQTFAPGALLQNSTAIQRRTRVNPRIDYQLSANSTLTSRYQFTRGDIQGAGIGGFDLVSRGNHVHYDYHTAQFVETSVLGSAINETRFQYYRNASQTLANTTGPAVNVLGSFNAGGGTSGRSFNTQNAFELHNNTSLIRGAHAWRFGVRARTQYVDDVSPQNFNGTFTFGGGSIDSIERYRRTLLYQAQGLPPDQIRALGGGATQFSISAGTPEVKGHQHDVAVFAGDDWRIKPNVTLSLGARYEAQGNIGDHSDAAPRIGVAWGLGRAGGGNRPKTVLRAGFGMFYDRFPLFNTLKAARYNGVVQQQYVVTNPDFFPLIPALPALASAQAPQVIQKVDPAAHAPYVMQSAVTLERELPKKSSLSVTYTNTHGVHLSRSEALITSGVPGAVYLMETTGIYNQNQLIVNLTTRINPAVSVSGSYTLNRAMSNTDGINTFPANPHSSEGEYGPAANDVRHRVSLNGSINTRWNVRFSPLLNVQSGAPFDITTGNDLYGTTLFNSRPGFAADPSRAGLIETAYGLLDPFPVAGEKLVPRNFGRGPMLVWANLRVSKIIGLGAVKEGAKASHGIFSAPQEHRYTLSISMSSRNLLNHTNPGPIIGNISSPLFGRANQMYGSVNGEGFSENADNRRLELQIKLAF